MKGFFSMLAGCATAAGDKLAGCKQKLAGCVIAAVLVISCAGTPPPFRVDAVSLELEDGYGGETTVSVDFYNNSDKTVTALEVSVPAAAGYLMRQEIVCTIPPGGSTRLDVIMDDAPAEPVAAAITEIVYEDGSRFFDPGGRSSILWW